MTKVKELMGKHKVGTRIRFTKRNNISSVRPPKEYANRTVDSRNKKVGKRGN